MTDHQPPPATTEPTDAPTTQEACQCAQGSCFNPGTPGCVRRESTPQEPRLYAIRDSMKLEPHFSAHMQAMTAEGLHAKSAIAAELAYRDAELAALRARLVTADAVNSELRQQVDAAERYAHMLRERMETIETALIYIAKGMGNLPIEQMGPAGVHGPNDDKMRATYLEEYVTLARAALVPPSRAEGGAEGAETAT